MSHGTTLRESPYIVYNRIPEPCSCISNSVGSWVVTSGNGSLSVEYYEKVLPETGYNAIRISPTNTDPVTLTMMPLQTTLEDRRDYLTFHGHFKPQQDAIVSVELMHNGNVEGTFRSELCPSSRWTLVRGEPILIPFSNLTFTFTMEITVSNHGGEDVLFWYPAVYAEYAFTRNLFVRECGPLIPEVFRTIDREQQYPSYPMFKFMDVGLSWAGYTYEQQQHFKVLDSETGYDANNESTWSGLINPEVADSRFLPWLAEITGTRLLGRSTSTTAWENFLATWVELHEDVDETVNETVAISTIADDGSGLVTVTVGSVPASFVEDAYITIDGTTNYDGQYQIISVSSTTFTFQIDSTVYAGPYASESTGDATFVDSSWEELEFYNISASGLEAYWRWQISNGYNGINSGSMNALKENIKFFLTGTKYVDIYKVPGEAFHLKIETLVNETRDGIEGESAEIIFRAIASTRPAGFKITHECVAA